MTTYNDPRLEAASLMLTMLYRDGAQWKDSTSMLQHVWNRLNRILQEPSQSDSHVISKGYTAEREVTIVIDGDLVIPARVAALAAAKGKGTAKKVAAKRKPRAVSR